MKKEKTRFRFLRSCAGLVIDNWGLKILALILAFVIYHALKPEDSSAKRINFERIDERAP